MADNGEGQKTQPTIGSDGRPVVGGDLLGRMADSLKSPWSTQAPVRDVQGAVNVANQQAEIQKAAESPVVDQFGNYEGTVVPLGGIDAGKTLPETPIVKPPTPTK